MGKLILIFIIMLAGCTIPQHRHFMTDYNGVMVEAIETGSGTVLYKVWETTGTI